MQSPARVASPSSNMSAKDRKAAEAKEFNVVLKALVQYFNVLVVLNTALGEARKGSYLAFPNPTGSGTTNGFHIFNRKHMRSANAKFAKEIMALKVFFRKSKKKTKTKLVPESFSGVYTPVYAGEALNAFFTQNPAGFGSLTPQQENTGLLMNALPEVNQRRLLRNTCTMLFFIYAHTNNLQFDDNAQLARSDEHMNNVFGGQIPAAYYAFKNPTTGKADKILMNEALDRNIVSAPMNTYDVISAAYPRGTYNKAGEDVGFDPVQFNTYYFQNISAANYFSRKALEGIDNGQEIIDQLNNGQIRAAMLNEHNIVKQASDVWRQLNEPIRKERNRIRKAAK